MRTARFLALSYVALLACALTLCAGPLQARDRVAVRLIAFNDLHGHLEPGDNSISVPDPRDPAQRIGLRAGGVAYLAGAVRRLRAEQPASVLISTGDLVGASPLASALFHDEPTIEVMNALGLDLNVAGNHEFDHGVDELRRLIGGGCAGAPRGVAETCTHPAGRYEGARFPFIAANVADAATGALLLPPYVVREVNGVRIGFVGAVTRATPGMVMPSGIRGWRFTAEAPALNRYARELKAAGVNTIVAVVHEGGDTDGGFDDCDNPRGPIFDIARALDAAIDVVLSAHTHRGYNCRIDGRVVIQGASFGRLLSVIDLAIDRDTGAPVRALTRARNLPVANGLGDRLLAAQYPPYPADREVGALVAHYRARVAPLADRSVGRIAAAFERMPAEEGDSPAGRLIADAHLHATRSNGAQVAFTNTGGIRSSLRPRAPNGTVTFGDIFTMQPFGNALVTMTLTGAQLKALLESQWRGTPARPHFLQPSASLAYAWREDAPPGSRIEEASIVVDGRPWRREATYRVTVNSYLAAGGDRFRLFLDGTEATGGPLDVDALAEYLTARSASQPLAVDEKPRITRRSAAAVAIPVR